VNVLFIINFVNIFLLSALHSPGQKGVIGSGLLYYFVNFFGNIERKIQHHIVKGFKL